MQAGQSNERAVFDFYRHYPFPQTTAEQRREVLPLQISKYRAMGVETALKGKVLDVGCGTGRMMAVPKFYKTQHFVGLDQSEAALAYAKAVAREDGVGQFSPAVASLFEMPFQESTFDLVVCWGVLHHTLDPLKGLKELVRVCRPGGFVAFFVFNPFAHWRHEIQRWRVRRKAGDDMERRFKEAHRLYGIKSIEDMTPADIIQFVDRYCVPIERTFSYGTVLKWLELVGLDYWGTSPPLRFRDFVAYMQGLAALREEHQIPVPQTSLHQFMHFVARTARKLPRVKQCDGASAKPTLLHRAFWQALLAWNGRRSDQSVGSSFCGRKRPAP